MNNYHKLQHTRSTSHAVEMLSTFPFCNGYACINIHVLLHDRTNMATHLFLFSIQRFFLFMNHPHRHLSTLFLENYKDYPEQFRYFACAVVKRRSEWASIQSAKVHFERLGHRDYYIDNLLSHIASLHNMLNLWHRGILNRRNFTQSCTAITTYTLDSHQKAIFNQIVQAMNDRNEHYSSIDEFAENSDDDDDIHHEDNMDCLEATTTKGKKQTPHNLLHVSLLTGKSSF